MSLAADPKHGVAHTPSFRVRLMFVRHGESQMNTRAHLLGGQHNHVPLTAKGEAQASLLGSRLAFDGTRFDHVYTSTAVRAMSTADIALRVAGLSATPIEHHDELLEQAQGEWEGKERKDVYTEQVHQDMLDLHMDFMAPSEDIARHSDAPSDPPLCLCSSPQQLALANTRSLARSLAACCFGRSFLTRFAFDSRASQWWRESTTRAAASHRIPQQRDREVETSQHQGEASEHILTHCGLSVCV